MGLIARTANQYWVGPMSNFGQMLTSGFATYQSATAMADRLESITNLAVDSATGCLILRPRAEVRDMVLAEWSLSSPTAWSLCTPESASWQARYLLSHVSTANAVSSATTRYLLPQAPGFAVEFDRLATPAGQTNAQRWRISWGRYFSLEFGGRRDTILAGPTIQLTRDTRPDEVKEFDRESRVRFDLIQAGYDLRIVCSAWRDEWLVRDVMRDLGGFTVGTSGYSPWIPSAPVTIAGTGGAYALSLQPYTYDTAGSAVTPWFDLFGARLQADATTRVFALPAQTAWGVGATVTLQVQSTKARYAIALTGPGNHTPYLGAWQSYWEPTFAAATDEWVEITDNVRGESMTLSLDGTATCDLELDNTGGVLADTIARGQMAFKATIGYQTTGSPTTYDRLMGIATTLGQQSPVSNDDTVSIKVVDRKKQLSDVELFFAPCLLGMPVDEAVPLLLRWAGINDFAADASYIATLDDPGRNYQNPPWLPAMGSTARELLDRICSSYDYRLEAFHGDGIIRLVDYWPTGSVAANYDTAPGADETVTVTDIETEDDFSDAKNMVTVIGKDINDRALYASLIDPQGLARMGYLAGVTDTNDDLTTQPAVNRAARALYDRLARSRRRVRLTSAHGTLWDRLPGDLITVTDPNMGYAQAQYVITRVNLGLSDEVISTDIDAEEVTST